MRKSVGIFVAAVVLSATACSSTDDRSGTEDEAGAAPSEELAATVTIPDRGDPTPGGSLTYGIEADTNSYDPTAGRWAPSGMQVGLSIFDPLAAYDETGRPQPYLAESITAEGLYERWVIQLRPDISFHDGTPVDSEAVKLMLEAHMESALTGPAVTPIDRIETPDPLTAVVVMERPWAAFPTVLTGQIGLVPAPAQLTADPEARSREPIGSGPFVLERWVPDDELRTKRNDDYWREGQPLLDAVIFKPLPDPISRSRALEAGDIDISHFNDPQSIIDFREAAADGEFQIIADPTEPEEVMLLLNHDVPPFDDVRMRRAVAHTIDIRRFIDDFNQGVYEQATGPFPPESPWYVESGFPQYDPAAARALIADYEADNGEATFEILAGISPYNQSALESFREDWEAVGLDVELEFVEQSAFIAEVIAGNYQAAAWRQWSSPDPDGDYIWWHSSSARPQGELSLNAGRVRDPEVDAALDEARTTLDVDERKESYAKFQRALAEEVHYVFVNHTRWSIVASNEVRDIPNGPLPDGAESMPFGGWLSATHRLGQVWLASDDDEG